ncbi:ABC transporter ATP-binding protein [Micromonospora lutea]|uniref:Tetronasin ABC transporter ATP-binding protein n=1 Tax=Micromonospora lutea TaxID=419825 RepID=A0ABQ4IPB2_9ACTN|nr:ABC transporter ATP-binding protein [Micromonospora lutea]GIJ19759.1 tetronasin ABC transporter ATP-binding protein [Micromonospora lutea]
MQHDTSGKAGSEPHLAIEAIDLRKSFGATRALDGFSLTVAAGEVHGFLGPNGAGKSTTIRALLGQLRLNGGECRIFGHDCWQESVAVHRRVAYVPGDVALWDGLSGGESIDVLMRLQGGGDRRRRDELVDRFELDVSKRTRSYSKGNRQKVALVAAFAKDADLYLLDEPTSGLDPLMEEAFQQTVREIKQSGKSILLSSHILSQVEALCDRLTIIRRGQTVASDTLEQLRGRTTLQVLATTERSPEALLKSGNVLHLVSEDVGGRTKTSFQVPPTALNDVMPVLVGAGLTGLTVAPPSLDEVFLSNYREGVEPEPEPVASAR